MIATRLVGLDEVGRGCWAGPLVVGAVILAQPIAGLKDSKKLSAGQRRRLAKLIYEQALATGLGWVESAEVDALGLTAAVQLAMERAIAEITIDYTDIIIDGNYNFLAHDPRSKTLIKADDSVPAVSAASIIAKVARDRYMIELAKTYPAYGFDRHVGYGTAAHAAALHQHGLMIEHRRSFRPMADLLALELSRDHD